VPAFTYAYGRYPGAGWRTVRLTCVGSDPARPVSSLQFSPEMGGNLFSLEVEGTEYLVAGLPVQDQPRLLGTPILYPSPNRVRNARFTFDGHTFEFEPNEGTNFLHGLVLRAPWECAEPVSDAQGISVQMHITFAPGTPIYERFPIRNTLALRYTLTEKGVRFDFAVSNEDSERRLPFGLGIHPFFRVIGPRESVRLEVPARKWMEADHLLPTGRLVDLEEAPADLRRPTPLSQLKLDDVFWGMEPERPAVIYYDSIGKKVTLYASDFFTHICVFTPPQYPVFCVENQSCSTDAHNLHARGLKEEAHLAILEPGESLSAWVEFVVSDE